MKARLIGGEHHGKVMDIAEGMTTVRLVSPSSITVMNEFNREVPSNLTATFATYRLVRIHYVRHILIEGVYCPHEWSNEQLFSWLLYQQ